MKEERKKILRDICARAPYRLKGRYHEVTEEGVQRDTVQDLESVDPFSETVLLWDYFDWVPADRFVPYLRPVYSMTEEEMDRLFDILHVEKEGGGEDWIKINDVYGIKFFLTSGRWMEEMDEALSYLRSIHIDIYGFIGKGLALEAPNGMYNV